MIHLSPHHQIELDPALMHMLERPPDRDYVIRRVSQKVVNGQPLIQGELVISGNETLEAYPLATKYPVHFRKTYYPTCFHQHPDQEYENHLAASRIIDVPPPIGSTRTTFRSCFLPGTPFDRLSPFGVEPPERNIQIAEEHPKASCIGLWYLLNSVYTQITALHENGFAHGDLFLHNIIISPAPIGAHLIDFEQAVHRDDEMTDEVWQEKIDADLSEILKTGIFLQCALGRQEGLLAEACLDALPKLFTASGQFKRSIERRTKRA